MFMFKIEKTERPGFDYLKFMVLEQWLIKCKTLCFLWGRKINKINFLS